MSQLPTQRCYLLLFVCVPILINSVPEPMPSIVCESFSVCLLFFLFCNRLFSSLFSSSEDEFVCQLLTASSDIEPMLVFVCLYLFVFVLFVCYLYGRSEDEFVSRLLPASSETKQTNTSHCGHVEKQQSWSCSRQLQLKQMQRVIFSFQIVEELEKCFKKIGKMFPAHVSPVEVLAHSCWGL